ncbi:MAG: transglutaminase domain-containing protein [Sulfurovaceae bacterium]|jgi:hypothetical protein
MKKISNLKVDKAVYDKTLKRYHKKEIEIYPDLAVFEIDKKNLKKELPIRRRVATLHEGKILYLKYFNFWVRAGIRADERAEHFFPDFENPNARIFNLIADIGVTTAPSNGEVHIWEKIRTVWIWLRNNVSQNNTEYGTISTTDGWPSIDEYAAYYETHGHLVWSACFSKAHLFASILGRVGIPRWRIMLITAHHTENGCPPTASHVFVAVYVNERWYYLDPTWVYSVAELPAFASIGSVGLFNTVDYMHPFKGIPIPGSDFEHIPMLNK